MSILFILFFVVAVVHPSIHPLSSVIICLFEFGSQRQQIQEGDPDISLPHPVALFRNPGDLETFPG